MPTCWGDPPPMSPSASRSAGRWSLPLDPDPRNLRTRPAGRPASPGRSATSMPGSGRARCASRRNATAIGLGRVQRGHWLWNIPESQVHVGQTGEMFRSLVTPRARWRPTPTDAIPCTRTTAGGCTTTTNDHVSRLSDRLDHEFRIVHPLSGEVRWIHACPMLPGRRTRSVADGRITVDETGRKRVELACGDRRPLRVGDDGIARWTLGQGPRTDAIVASEAMKVLSGHEPGADIRTNRTVRCAHCEAGGSGRIEALGVELMEGRIDRADHGSRSCCRRQSAGCCRVPSACGRRRRRADPARRREVWTSPIASEPSRRGAVGGQLRQARSWRRSAPGGQDRARLQQHPCRPSWATARWPCATHLKAAASGGIDAAPCCRSARQVPLSNASWRFSRSGIAERVPVHVDR